MTVVEKLIADADGRSGFINAMGRCQNCGEPRKNHGPRKSCKGKYHKGQTFTPWTREAWAAAVEAGERAAGVRQ